MARKKAVEGKDYITSYCSWCLSWCRHDLVERNYLSRNVYKCSNCGNYTVQCRVCDCMARDRPCSSASKDLLQAFKDGWSSECCAAHDGTIASWDKLDIKISTPDKFREIVERDNEWDMVKTPGATVAAAVAGALVGPIAGPIAGSIASALGSASFLGMGSMATGSQIVSAVGAALGGGVGAMLTNSYLAELKDFDIRRVDKGDANRPAIIFINGFLQQDADIDDWLDSVERKFPDNPKYHLNWNSKRWEDLVCTGNVLTGLAVAWLEALDNAGKAGACLADILSRTTGHRHYIFMGHSLGCRVAYYASKALLTRNEMPVKEMYLLSGAVGNNEWDYICRNIDHVYNFYSPDDNIVGPIYKGASVTLEDTIGIAPINCHLSNVRNYDVTRILERQPSSWPLHMRYKDSFDEMLELCPNKHLNSTHVDVGERTSTHGVPSMKSVEVMQSDGVADQKTCISRCVGIVKDYVSLNQFHDDVCHKNMRAAIEVMKSSEFFQIADPARKIDGILLNRTPLMSSQESIVNAELAKLEHAIRTTAW